jgi:hypothetical protein
VDVVFVVPHVFGDEDTTSARLLGTRGWVVDPAAAAGRRDRAVRQQTTSQPPAGSNGGSDDDGTGYGSSAGGREASSVGGRGEPVAGQSAPAGGGPTSAGGAGSGQQGAGRATSTASGTAPGSGSATAAGGAGPGGENAGEAATLRVLGVDSALLPYLDAGQYGERVSDLEAAPGGRETASREEGFSAAAGPFDGALSFHLGTGLSAGGEATGGEWRPEPAHSEADPQAPIEAGAPPGPVSLGVQSARGGR